MTDEIQAAVVRLQKLNHNTSHLNPFVSERIERALDFLLNNPDSTGDPGALVRSAMGSAYKLLKRRQAIRSLVTEAEIDDRTLLANAADTVADAAAMKVTLRRWLERAPLLDADRAVLAILLDGGSAEDVAWYFHVPVTQGRVRVSRARARARRLWGARSDA